MADNFGIEIEIAPIQATAAKAALATLDARLARVGKNVRIRDREIKALNKSLREMVSLLGKTQRGGRAAVGGGVPRAAGRRVGGGGARGQVAGARRGGGGIFASQLAQTLVNIPGLGRLSGGLSDVAAQGARGASALGRLSAAAGPAGVALLAAGAAVAVLVGALAVLGIGVIKSISQFRQFEVQLVKVGKVADIEGQELVALGRNFANLSTIIPTSAGELLQFAEVAAQLGIRGSQNLEIFAVTMAKLGAASNLTGEEGARALVRIAQLTDFDISGVDKLASAIVELGNNFATTESSIARTAQRVAQELSPLRPAARDVLALGTAIDALGIRAERGASALGRTFVIFREKVLEGDDALQQLSVASKTSTAELEQLAAAADPQKLINFFAASKNVRGILKALGISGTETTGVLTTLTNNIDLVNRAFEKADTKSVVALNEEALKAFNTLDAQVIRFRNTIQAAAIGIGKQFAPQAKALVKVLAEAARAFGANDAAAVAAFPAIAEIGRLIRELGPDVATLVGRLIKFALTINTIPFRLVGSLIISFAEGVESLINTFDLLSISIDKTTTSLLAFVGLDERLLRLIKLLSGPQKLVIEAIFSGGDPLADPQGTIDKQVANLITVQERLTAALRDQAVIDLLKIEDPAEFEKELKAQQKLIDDVRKRLAKDILAKGERFAPQAVALVDIQLVDEKTIGIQAEALREFAKALDIFSTFAETSTTKLEALQAAAAKGLSNVGLSKTAQEIRDFNNDLIKAQKNLIALRKQAERGVGKQAEDARKLADELAELLKTAPKAKIDLFSAKFNEQLDVLSSKEKQANIFDGLSGSFEKEAAKIISKSKELFNTFKIIAEIRFGRELGKAELATLEKRVSKLTEEQLIRARINEERKIGEQISAAQRALKDFEAQQLGGEVGQRARLGNLFDDALRDIAKVFGPIIDTTNLSEAARDFAEIINAKNFAKAADLFGARAGLLIAKESRQIGAAQAAVVRQENAPITNIIDAEKFISKAFRDAEARQLEREVITIADKQLTQLKTLVVQGKERQTLTKADI